MVVATAALGLVIGLVIGGLGGGGGALTVPALVYLLGLTAQDATTSSVLIVGISSLAGVLTRIRDRSLRLAYRARLRRRRRAGRLPGRRAEPPGRRSPSCS